MKESWTVSQAPVTQNEKNHLFIVFIDGLTNNSSILVWHFSRFILFMATRSCLGVHRAACTTAVAPLPEIQTTQKERKKNTDVSKGENRRLQKKRTQCCIGSVGFSRLFLTFQFSYLYSRCSSVTPAETLHKTRRPEALKRQQRSLTRLVTNQAAAVVAVCTREPRRAATPACQLVETDKRVTSDCSADYDSGHGVGGGGGPPRHHHHIAVSSTQLWPPTHPPSLSLLSPLIRLVSSSAHCSRTA